jgi:hypothetical protein
VLIIAEFTAHEAGEPDSGVNPIWEGLFSFNPNPSANLVSIERGGIYGIKKGIY